MDELVLNEGGDRSRRRAWQDDHVARSVKHIAKSQFDRSHSSALRVGRVGGQHECSVRGLSTNCAPAQFSPSVGRWLAVSILSQPLGPEPESPLATLRRETVLPPNHNSPRRSPWSGGDHSGAYLQRPSGS